MSNTLRDIAAGHMFMISSHGHWFQLFDGEEVEGVFECVDLSSGEIVEISAAAQIRSLSDGVNQ